MFLYFEVFTFKDFSEMILAAITVTILFEPLVERALASETFLLISRPGHVGNVFTIEFIVRRLPCLAIHTAISTKARHIKLNEQRSLK